MPWTHEVAGSSPVTQTIWSFGVAGARACLKSKRTWFDSTRLHRIKFFENVTVVEWSMAVVCKTIVSAVRIRPVTQISSLNEMKLFE